MKDIGRKAKRVFTIKKSTFLICKHLDIQGKPFKIFIFERLMAKRPGKNVSHDIWENVETSKHPNIEYRFGYFIIGKNGNKKGRWTWGQFCPMIGHSDYIALIKLAVKEGVILK